MTTMTPDISTFSDQINRLIAENRRLLKKSEADDKTIHLLKEQYEGLHNGVEDMVEDHRRIERDLVDKANRHELAYTEIVGLLDQAADLIVQAARARVGNVTPEKMPERQIPSIQDDRLPIARLSS